MSDRATLEIMDIQYYNGNLDIPCSLIPRYGLPWCPVIKGEQILRAQVTISNTSRVVDQVYALNCTVLGLNLSGSMFEALEVCL